VVAFSQQGCQWLNAFREALGTEIQIEMVQLIDIHHGWSMRKSIY
jgi:hypothetical protein